MNSPNYPPQGPYGPPQGQPYGQRPPQTPPGGQPYGGPPPQGPPFGAPPPQDLPYGAPPPQGPPYGAPPPQGQPFGGPPPGGFGPPPGGPAGPPPAGPPPGAFPPPAPVAKSGGAGKIIKIVIAIAVVGAGVVFGIMNWGTSAAAAKVGECIKVTDEANADVEKIDCNSAEATYKVGATFDSSTATCPEGDYVSYTQGGRRTSDVTLCLMLNAEEGDCFAEGTQSDTKVDCTAPDASFQVGAILNDTVDESGCPETTEYFRAYSEPKPMVHCLTAPGGGATT